MTREETLATAKQNAGSILVNQRGIVTAWNVKNLADARVNKARGVVVCSTVNINYYGPGNPVLPRGVYHPFDYPFYYHNLRNNAMNRTKIFLRTWYPWQKKSNGLKLL